MYITVYNDTNTSINFGCQLVSKSLREAIKLHFPNSTVEYIPMHSRECYIGKTDLVIINGEGSFGRNDGKEPDGYRLLKRVVDYHKDQPVYLINTTIQSTRKEVTKLLPYLQKCKLVTLREPLSLDFLDKNTNLKNTRVYPDLGTFYFKDKQPVKKDIDIVFGLGSIYKTLKKDKNNIRLKLYAEVINEIAQEGYTVTVQDFPSNPKGDLEALSKFIHKDIPKQKGTFEDYFTTVQRAKLNVTGRHHGVVMSFIGRTPFITFDSNMWKTEGDQALYGPFTHFKFREIAKDKLKILILQELSNYNQNRVKLDKKFDLLYPNFDGHIKAIKDNEQ